MRKVKYSILAVFLGLHLLYSLFLVIPGCLVIDDVTYLQMTKNFSDFHSLGIWNGYDEFPSRELVGSGQLRVHNGRLVAQYPYLYPVLAWPFYRLPRFREIFSKRLWLSLSLVLLLAGIAGFQPQVHKLGYKLWHGVHQIVVDLRIPENAVLEPLQSRSPGGGLLYIGILKKSLLQSCPYLVILLLPLATVVRRDQDTFPLLALFLVPATFTGIFWDVTCGSVSRFRKF
jgi:hypothetical protein